MKRTQLAALLGVILAGTLASAQSLGEYARTARKNKRETAAASHHYDNDNLPTHQQLSVVGPAADNPQARDANATSNAAMAASAPAAAVTGAQKDDKEKAAHEMRDKLDRQREKIAGLNHELDLQQREYKLKAAAYYSDAGARLRDAALFDKQQAQHQSDVESKQKAIDAARQDLEQMQEDARKAGVADKDDDRGKQ